MPRTAALFAVMMSFFPLGCATAVHPGLANAPALGTSPVSEASAHDAIANGPDSCDRQVGPGPLRYQFPPCPRVERSPGDSGLTVANRASRAPSTKGIVMPWVEHYYPRWPCPASKNMADQMTLARSPVPYAASRGTLSARTCTMPL
jgi:hypothetical protein